MTLVSTTYFDTMREVRKDRERIEDSFKDNVLDCFDRFWSLLGGSAIRGNNIPVSWMPQSFHWCKMEISGGRSCIQQYDFTLGQLLLSGTLWSESASSYKKVDPDKPGTSSCLYGLPSGVATATLDGGKRRFAITSNLNARYNPSVISTEKLTNLLVQGGVLPRLTGR